SDRRSQRQASISKALAWADAHSSGQMMAVTGPVSSTRPQGPVSSLPSPPVTLSNPAPGSEIDPFAVPDISNPTYVNARTTHVRAGPPLITGTPATPPSLLKRWSARLTLGPLVLAVFIAVGVAANRIDDLAGARRVQTASPALGELPAMMKV